MVLTFFKFHISVEAEQRLRCYLVKQSYDKFKKTALKYPANFGMVPRRASPFSLPSPYKIRELKQNEWPKVHKKKRPINLYTSFFLHIGNSVE